MNVNYENRYVYAEVYEILKWLGKEYISKIPKKYVSFFKNERKFGYDANIDFSKPISSQIRQETKNYIAFFEYYYWLDDEEKMKKLKEKIFENAEKRKQREKLERLNNLDKNKYQVSNNYVVNQALKDLNNPD